MRSGSLTEILGIFVEMAPRHLAQCEGCKPTCSDTVNRNHRVLFSKEYTVYGIQYLREIEKGLYDSTTERNSFMASHFHSLLV